MNRGGKKGGRNHKFFDSLTPLQRALDVATDVPRVSGGDSKSLNSSSLDDRLEKHAAKLARRAARAGHKP